MRIPKYRRHSSRDIAFVETQGKRVYLPGRFGSTESRMAYAKLCDELKAQSRQAASSEPLPRPARNQATVADVVVAFLAHAKTYYATSRGSSADEFECCRIAGERLIRFAGLTHAESFGPLKLKAFRDSLIDYRFTRGKSEQERRLSRRYINMQLNRVRRMFRWAASEELVSSSVWQSLKTVDGLRSGRTEAPDTDKRQPVDWHDVELTLPELSPDLARAVELQWLTGVRPQSIVEAQADQFDLDEKTWRPRHKNEFRGQILIVPLGPRAVQLVCEQIEASRGSEYLFCPILASGRSDPRHTLKYTVHSYKQALQRAQKRAGVFPLWTPHQLRHGRATEIRQSYGLEAAQAVLGHASIDATQIYASRLFELARRVSDETG